MIGLLTLMTLLTSVLLFSSVLLAVFRPDKRLNTRMKRYLKLNDKRKLSRKKFNLLVQMRLYRQAVSDKLLTKQKNDRLERWLARSGLAIRPEDYVWFQWIALALGAGLLMLLTGSAFFALLGGALGFVAPKWFVNRKIRARIELFNDGLQDMITTVIGSLRAGFSFPQALKTVVQESDGPMRQEMETVLMEMQYGSSMEDALNRLKERMPSDDLDLMIQAILIQRQVGGNLAVILETIVQTIRDRNKVQRQIKTLTAQGRLSGIVIGLLPVVIGVVLYFIQPAYIGSMFTHPVGLMMLGGGGVSGVIGFVLMRQMTRIEV